MWNVSAEEYVKTLVYDCGRLAAAVACHGGAPRPIDWVEHVFFLGMVDELEARVNNRRVIADMFRVDRRTLRRRIERSENAIEIRSQSTWWAVWEFMNVPRSQSAVLAKFSHLQPDVIASILKKLIATGWAFETDDGYLRQELREIDRGDLILWIEGMKLIHSDEHIGELLVRSGLSEEEANHLVDGVQSSGSLVDVSLTNLWTSLTLVGLQVSKFAMKQVDGERTSQGKIWSLRVNERNESEKSRIREWFEKRCMEGDTFYEDVSKLKSNADVQSRMIWSFFKTEEIESPFSERHSATRIQKSSH